MPLSDLFFYRFVNDPEVRMHDVWLEEIDLQRSGMTQFGNNQL